jgi:hypothetical protein
MEYVNRGGINVVFTRAGLTPPTLNTATCRNHRSVLA